MMSRFGNRIIHLHNYIDIDTLYDILVNELYDIKEFYENPLKLIEKYENQEG